MVKLIFVLPMVVLAAASLNAARAAAPKAAVGSFIVKSGQARCTIIIPDDATPGEKYAARELQDHIKQITGATLPEVNEHAWSQHSGAFVSIGRTKLSQKYVSDEQISALGDDGYQIFSKNGSAFFLGGRKRGSMYAIYQFLESLGVRWYSPDYTVVPKLAEVKMPSKPFEYTPKIWYRDQWWNNGTTSEWLARMRVNGSNGQDHQLPDEMGGSAVTLNACHSFGLLVPPSANFAKHPEWFALRSNGARSENELCLTNQELRDFVVQRVLADVKARNGQVDNYWVSQNDGLGEGCSCEKCTAERLAHGGKDRFSANIIGFVSYIADKVRPEYPKVHIKTLAYNHTTAAPENMHAPDNVLVEVCGNFAPGDDPHHKLVQSWSKVVNNISVYTYGGSNYGYWWPYPNARQVGMQYPWALESGVRAFYVQGTALGKGSGLVDLKAYLSARLAWDPSRDVEKEIRDFCNGFYGPGGKYIVDYLDWYGNYIAQHKMLMEGGWGDAERWRDWVNKETMLHCDELFQQAMAADKDNPAYLNHVRRAYLEVLWGSIMVDLQPKTSLSDKDLVPLPGVDASAIKAKAKLFGEIMRENGYNKWSEPVTFDPATYPH